MRQLPKWVLTNPMASIYDSESVTAIEMVSKLYGTIQKLIEEWNTNSENWREEINQFMTDSLEEYEGHQFAMRQEFQDFIDTVDLKIRNMDAKLEDIVKDTEEYARELVASAINEGKLKVSEHYNAETEALTLSISGEV